MWVNKNEWKNLSNSLKTINHELGDVQADMRWVKYLLGFVLPTILGSNVIALLKLCGVL